MADIQQITDAMLEAAGTVLGRLVDQPVAATGASPAEHEGSIKIDSGALVTSALIPSLGITVVVRFKADDVAQVVGMMLGSPDEAAEMGAMQMSIVSETVSQIAAAMGEELAKGLGAAGDGVKADLVTDATNLPPPPFVSFEGTVQVGTQLAAEIGVHYDGIAAAKIGAPQQAVAPEPMPVPAMPAPEPEAAPPRAPRRAERPERPVPPAAPVQFAAMAPTQVRSGHGGTALDLVHDVPLQISAVLGRTDLTLRDVVSLQSGSVFELDKLSADPIDLYVNNILIARGEVVVVDDKYAVKISEINPTAE